MNSMTGYGFKESIVENTQVSVEIKSVNNRFLDINVGVPPFLGPLEPRIRNIVSEKVVRGKIDVTVRVKDLGATVKVCPDPAAALRYFEAMRQIAAKLGRADADIPLGLVLGQDGVLNVTREYDLDGYWAKIRPVFSDVLSAFVSDRAREGENLRRDLLAKLSVLDSCAAFFERWQPEMERRFAEQVSARFRELLGERADENRIMAEVAAMMVRYTINEEIVRLKSHLRALRAELGENPAPGKRIDFICQETNREINTIGSKNQFAEVGAMVIDAKDALENIREQAKNVE